MDAVLGPLQDIVGEDYASASPEELYLYGRDLGTAEPQLPAYVVAPRSTEEVQAVVRLANREKLAITPLGGGLSLTGLVVPLAGGIVVDMKRMDRILEVDERSRYALVEAGCSQGKLATYLDRHHPTLIHSEPGAPPQATIGGNVMIHGQGDLALHGFNSAMVAGMQVVLPTGEVCRVGSCALSESWFARPPLPDLAGLFLGWFGTTGIITRLSLQLYPRKRIRDSEIFVVDDPDLVPEVAHRVTHTQVGEDLVAWSQEVPPTYRGLHNINISFGGDSEKELELKRELVCDQLEEYVARGDGGFLSLDYQSKKEMLKRPQIDRITADIKKGGGFEYVGAIIPVDRYPECWRRGVEISGRHDIAYTLLGRVIGPCHAMMYSWTYAFNRADPASVAAARQALHETDELVISLGGVPWKPGLYAQRLIREAMDPNTRELMSRVKKLLDPAGIMNPGNWEA